MECHSPLSVQREQGAKVLLQRSILGAILLEERVDARENKECLVEYAVGAFLVCADSNQVFRGRVGGKQLPKAARLGEMLG